MSGGIVRAPFSPDQVDSLNAAMESEWIHPMTCGNDCPVLDVIDNMPMFADEDGMHCIVGCERKYTQDWAPGWMADWSWQKNERIAIGRHRRESRKTVREIRRVMRIFGRSEEQA